MPRSFTVVPDDMVLPPALRGAAVAIGNFDGVHLGHRHVIAAAQARARAEGRPALVLTFEPHPRSFFKPDPPLFRLSPPSEKLRLLEALGLDGAVVATFDAGLAGLTAEAFVSRVLVDRLGVGAVAVGFDFQFGKGRGGTPDYLVAEGERHGFAVDLVPAFALAGEPVSSSAVRAALAAGDTAQAARLLGRLWRFAAEVIHGDKRGRTLGYPTANLKLAAGVALKTGIYAVRVTLGDGSSRHGVASYGRRPTFDDGQPLFEIHLFDFAGDLYGQTLQVEPVQWQRAELRFDSAEALVAQMHADAATARAILASVAPAEH